MKRNGWARMVGGPWDGEHYPRGNERWQGTVLSARPDRETLQLINSLYMWDGVSRWYFERFVFPHEDIRGLCFPRAESCSGR